MKGLLVFDTCGTSGYVAVVDASSGPGPLSERTLEPRRTQEELLPAIDAVLAEAGLAPGELLACAATVGPGSFTGVRIGLATAKGLCEAAGVPLLALSRLAVLALAAEDAPVSAWLDAGRSEVYALRVDTKPVDATSQAGALLSRHEAAHRALGSRIVVCEAALEHAAPDVVRIADEAFNAALRRAAVMTWEGQQRADTALVDALYLRLPDAENALRTGRR